jgi:hypothetical protein
MEPLLGGLEPHFRVLFSAIFLSTAQGNCRQRGKQWKVVEAKLLQTAASLRTCFVLVIHPRAPKPLVPFLGILSSGCQNIELSFRSWPKRNQYLANSFPGPAPFRGNSNQQVLSPLNFVEAIQRQFQRRASGRGDLANKVFGVVQVQNFGRQKKVSYR